ncbi:hypothetical protein Pmani_026515 [Petrolisthes manimaculis]|uniref:Uncharacterized protein n=1 Tax=Petrolisthes manimaculis TaxID=1843537 RepID=A0AAE1P4I6_9EUCA|nr:hypothetical protein Pmani_026515 [Petrolisthes manimaculis]
MFPSRSQQELSFNHEGYIQTASEDSLQDVQSVISSYDSHFSTGVGSETSPLTVGSYDNTSSGMFPLTQHSTFASPYCHSPDNHSTPCLHSSLKVNECRMEQEHLTTSLPSMNLPTSHGVTSYTTSHGVTSYTTSSSPDVSWGGAMPDTEHTTTQSIPSVSSTVSRRKKKSGCKEKMYELPMQDDPNLEKRRTLAVKEFMKRQRVKKEEEELRHVLATTTQETNTMKENIVQTQANINWYRQQLGLSPISPD